MIVYGGERQLPAKAQLYGKEHSGKGHGVYEEKILPNSNLICVLDIRRSGTLKSRKSWYRIMSSERGPMCRIRRK